MIPTNQYWFNNTQKSNPLANGLLWYYKFNQNTLRTVGKQDGIGVNLTYAPDTTGYKAVFNSNSRIYIDDSSDFDFASNDFTINVDVEFDELNRRQVIFGQNNEQGTDTSISLICELGADNKITVYVFYAGTAYFQLTNPSTSTTGVKYVIIFKRQANNYSLKINDSVVASTTVAATINSTLWKMCLGATGEYVDSNIGLHGKISLFRGWNRITDNAEDTELYNGGVGNKFNCLTSPLSTDLLQTQPIDGNSVGYSTFQSNKQSVVVNDNGIFTVHVHSTTNPLTYDNQTWYLKRSTDNGRTFTTVYTGTTYAGSPCIETDSLNNLYLVNITSNINIDFLKFDNTDYTTPSITTSTAISYASKHNMVLDDVNNKLYYFIGRGAMIIFNKSGSVLTPYTTILATGTNAHCMYLSATLDNSGNLYVAWTTQKLLGPIIYYDIHWMKSTNSGVSFTKADGTPIVLPVVDDDTGPTDAISLPAEAGGNVWLSSWTFVNDRLHAAYWVDGVCQKYARINPSIGAQEQNYSIHNSVSPNVDGGFIRIKSGTLGSPTDLYFLTTTNGRTDPTLYKTTDNGDSWSIYANRYQQFPWLCYSVGTYRENVNGKGFAVFTLLTPRASTYTENESSYTYFCKLNL